MALVINAGYEYGQGTALFCRKQSGFRFVGIVDCLYQNKVCACGRTDFDCFRENINGFFKRQITERLNHFACRADVERNESFIALAGSFGVADCRRNDFGKIVEFKTVCAECAGSYDLCSGFKIKAVHFNDFFRLCDVPALGVFAGLESVCLKKSSRSAVAVGDSAFYFFKNVHFFTSISVGAVNSAANHTAGPFAFIFFFADSDNRRYGFNRNHHQTVGQSQPDCFACVEKR